MTKRQLAIALGKSEPTITYYEKGLEPPSADMERLAEILDFPVGFFYSSELDDFDEGTVTFRARRKMTLGVRAMATARCKLSSKHLTPAFAAGFNLPTNNLPEIDIDIRKDGAAEVAARELRNYWQLGFGPVGNLVHLLEANGVRVYWIDNDSPSVFAFSFWRDNEPYIFLSTPNNSGERARFSAAHELGHLILHKDIDRLDAHEIEAQADEFASAFLMPKEQLIEECPRTPILDSLLRLKPRWGTSVSAMVVRLYRLGVYTQWYYENAFKEISARGWRKAEPYPVEREQSYIHDFIYSHLAQQGITSQDVAANLTFSFNKLSELTPMARKYANRRLRHLELFAG